MSDRSHPSQLNADSLTQGLCFCQLCRLWCRVKRWALQWRRAGFRELTGCVTLDRSLNPSETPCPSAQSGHHHFLVYREQRFMSCVERLVRDESSINVDYVIFTLNNYKLVITLFLTTMASSLPLSLSPSLSLILSLQSGSQRTNSC